MIKAWKVWALDSMWALNLIKSRIVASYKTLKGYKRIPQTSVIFRYLSTKALNYGPDDYPKTVTLKKD